MRWARCWAAILLALPSARAGAEVVSQAAETVVYDQRLAPGWQYWGWKQAPLSGGGPMRLDFSPGHGLILASHRPLAPGGILRFRLQAPARLGAFLQVGLGGPEGSGAFVPAVPVPSYGADGWATVVLPLAQLNPQALPYDRLTMKSVVAEGAEAVAIDQVVLLAGPAAGPPPAAAPAARRRPGRFEVDCRAAPRRISPLIYGIAFDPMRAKKDGHIWSLGPTVRRWGGNNTSRYNWRHGRAWNTASDWFFKNVNYTSDPTWSWSRFIEENRAHRVGTTMSIPMLGWVAKDTSQVSFPVDVRGRQQFHEGNAGNGVRPDGTPLPSPPPSQTSVAAPPSMMGAWVEAIARLDRRGGPRSLVSYVLDNEPMLWNTTHRDVHPDPLTYDELMARTLAYAAAIRRADPEVPIAGPAEWGWPGYFYSAQDAQAGFTIKPDRRAHGDTPLIEWYLDQLHAHHQRTHVRLLDILDFHYYPQSPGTYGRQERTDPAASRQRLEVTRSLWDPSYTDPSWINEKIALLPRMRRLAGRHQPPLEISLGEYNFGGERHISGALAEAEALGRFAEAGVHSAYYWTYPPAGSFVAAAFRAYRDFDGHGAAFAEGYLPSEAPAGARSHASIGHGGRRLVVMLMNFAEDTALDAELSLVGARPGARARRFQLTARSPELEALPEVVPAPAAGGPGLVVTTELPPWSLQVVELVAPNA